MGNHLEMINRYAGRPVYRQLSDLLEARLADEARPGDRLPSEAELSQEFDVNRLTSPPVPVRVRASTGMFRSG